MLLSNWLIRLTFTFINQVHDRTWQGNSMLSLTKAAEEVGISRSALFKAIKNGRVSASKNDKGEFLIDPSELFRVYQPVNKVNVNLYQPSQQQDIAKEAVEISLLKQLLKQVESERDDLRRRLDDEAQERRKLTMLLTHQSEPETRKEDNTKLLFKLFGKHRPNG